MKKILIYITIETVAIMGISCDCPSRPIKTPEITQAPSLMRGRGGHAAGLVNGCVVVAGGTDWSLDRTEKFWLDDSVVYINDTWQSGPVLPHPVAYSMFASDRTGLYIAGGTDGQSYLDTVYHLSNALNGGWKRLCPLPEPVASGGGAILNSRLYVACGWSKETLSNKMWSFDTRRPDATWQPCRSLPGDKRAFPALTACGDYLYLLGGMAPDDDSLNVLQDAWRYDPQHDLWTKLKDLSWKGYAWAAQSLNKDHLILTGKADGIISKDIYVLNVTNECIYTVGQAIIQTTTAPLVRVASDEFWLIGGEPDANKTRTSIITSIQFKDHDQE